MMYLREISSVEVGEEDKPKVEAEKFRYESQTENSHESPYTLDNNYENNLLMEDLIGVFRDISKQQLVKLEEGTYKKPDILVELKLQWEECCAREDEKDDDCDEEIEFCYECPYHKEYKACFVHGNNTIGTLGDQLMPLEAIGGVVKNMPKKNIGESRGPSVKLKIYNFDAGSVIITFENVRRYPSLKVEINTTEIEATKEVLRRMGLLPKGRK